MEIRNIILELGVDKDGDTFCKEIRNNTVEIESSWNSYRALSYSDTYKNKHDDTTTVLHIAYDDARDMVLHMKVSKTECEFITVYDSKSAEKELYRSLDAILTLRNTLNHSEVWGWVDDCYKDYQESCNVEYLKASENALRFNEEVVILEAEWKYASMIKERWCEEHPSDKMVITHHKSGGTVYTTTDYEILSFEVASFIGTSYGNNGGGHKHAAGFGCLDLAVASWLDEDEMRAVVKDRIYRALGKFFNKGGN